MTCNNPKLDLVNMKAQFVLKILSGNEILAQIKGHNSGTNERKIMCNNPKLDFFGEILSISSQDIERK